MSVSPIFQATAKNTDIMRSKGHSSVASAAYIAGLDVVEKRNGATVAYHRYARKEEVLFSDIMLPKDASDDIPRDPIAYWQAREEFEDQYLRNYFRKSGEYAEERVRKAQIALKQIIPLPAAWTPGMMREFGQRYAEAFVQEYGLPVHVAGHDDRLISKSGGERGKGKKASKRDEREGEIKKGRKNEEPLRGLNNHLHVQIDHRPLRAEGWGSKPAFLGVSTFARNAWTLENRQLIADLINEISASHGLDIVAEAKSFEQRGSPFTATIHEGQSATAMRRRGRTVGVAVFNEQVKAENREEVIRNPDTIIQHISLTRATFSEADLKRELFNRLQGDDADYALVEHRMMASDLLVKVGEDVEGRTRYATKEYIDREKRMFAAANDLAKSAGHEADLAVLEKGLSERFSFLSDEQVDAVRLLSSGSAFGMIKGAAGVGKSTLLKAVIPAAEAAGQNVRGFAPTGQAAKVLGRETGLQTNTWASYAFRREKAQAAKDFIEKATKEKRNIDKRAMSAMRRDIAKFDQIRLRAGDFVLVDEAGMMSVKDMAVLLDEVRRAGAKVRLIGDDSQFSSVEAGAAFRGLLNQFGGANVLTIRRQKKDWARKASMDLERGDMRSGLGAYRDRGFVRFEADRASTYHAVVDAYMADLAAHPAESRLMLAYTKRDVAALNKIARDRHVAAGLVDADGVEIADQVIGRGDKVVFRANDLSGFKVKGLDGYSEGVANGSTGIVEKIEGKGREAKITVRLSGDNNPPNRVIFVLDDYDSINLAYSLTSHSSQGGTYPRVIALASKYHRADAMYVTMTRHEQDAILFVDSSETRNFDELVRSSSRKSQSDLVRDYQPVAPGDAKPDPAWDLARRISASRQDVTSLYAGMVNWKEHRDGEADLKDHPDYQLYRASLKRREEEAQRALEYMKSYDALRAKADSQITPEQRAARDFAGHLTRVLEQNGMRRDLISLWANDSSRLRTDAEKHAVEKLETYAGANRAARDLYNAIKKEVGTDKVFSHLRWEERQSLVLERDALAAEIVGNSPAYRRHLHEVKGVSWQAVGRQAAAHEMRNKTSDPVKQAVEMYKALGKQVRDLHQKSGEQLSYRKAVAEHDRMALEFTESVPPEKLKTMGVYPSILHDQAQRHLIREQFSAWIHARNVGDSDAPAMKLAFGQSLNAEAARLKLPNSSLTARPYHDVLSEHGIKPQEFMSDLRLDLSGKPAPSPYRPKIRSTLGTVQTASPAEVAPATQKPKIVAEPVATSVQQTVQKEEREKDKEPVQASQQPLQPLHRRLDAALEEGSPWLAVKVWAEILPKSADLDITETWRGRGFTQRRHRKALEDGLYQAYGESGRAEVDFAIRAWQDDQSRALPMIEAELNSRHRLRGKRGLLLDDAERKAANAAVAVLPKLIAEAGAEAEQSDRDDARRRDADVKIADLTKELGPKYSDPEQVRKVWDSVGKSVRAAILRDPVNSYYQAKALEAETKTARVLGIREEETWNPAPRIAGLRRESARAALKSPVFQQLPETEQVKIRKDARVPSTGGGHSPAPGSGISLK